MTITTPQESGPERDGATSDVDERFDEIARDLSRYRISRDSWTMIVFAIAAAAAIFSIVGMGLALRKDDGGGSAGPSINAQLTEFAVGLSSAQIGVGGTIEVQNVGTMAHDLKVEGSDITTGTLDPGESATLDLSDLEPGTYTLFCTIPGHAGSGMSTTLVIGDGAGAQAATDHADHDALTPEQGAAQDMVMIESVMAFPAETAGRGNEVLEPEVMPDGTKHFELTASIVDWEVAPGQVVQAWAYNGMVPGPRINVEVGDEVEFELTNNLPIGTDIHWHGIDVPNEMDGVAPITQDMVPSGGTFTYRFTVKEAAIGMYHAHAHGHLAIPNGLFGTFYAGTVGDAAGQTISGIDVPADLEISQDIPMVVNDAGVIGLTLNGKSFPATEPLVVTEGDWIRVTYFNEGLQAHPMHLHGFEQLVIAKDGEPLDAPYAADTILVGPGERYTVLFHADVAGTWVWHCHILNHAESDEGMFGMVTAVIVQPA